LFQALSLGIFFFSNKKKGKKHKEKKTIEKKKYAKKKREGTYLSSLAFVFGMKCSSCFLLSTFLQR
jgi:hypothetical protein